MNCLGNAAQEQVDTASPASSFDFNDFTTEATNAEYRFIGNSGYANPFLMPDIPVDLDAFADNFDWVCCAKDLVYLCEAG